MTDVFYVQTMLLLCGFTMWAYVVDKAGYVYIDENDNERPASLLVLFKGFFVIFLHYLLHAAVLGWIDLLS